jgi:hypothetical protein
MFRKQDTALIQFADEIHVGASLPYLLTIVCFYKRVYLFN